jgi:quinol monooxygenase YgiN
MHAVITTVTLKPGSIETVARMFEDTYMEVIKDEECWRSARFTANHATNTITVVTTWTSDKDYEALRHTERFQTTFARFMEYFAAPPIVMVNEVLYDAQR